MEMDCFTGQWYFRFKSAWEMAARSIVDQGGITSCIIREKPHWRLAY